MAFDERWQHRWLNEIHPGSVEDCKYPACIRATQTGDGAALPVRGTAGGSTPAAAPSSPRLFELYRHRDVSGVSGTGVVALGVQWPDGTVSMRWLGETPSFANWADVYMMLAAHGHSGATVIRWLDGV